MTVKELIILLVNAPDDSVDVVIEEITTGFHLHDIEQVVAKVDEFEDKPVICLRYREG